MGVKGIDHRVIVSGDLERTLDFYQRLGFKIAREPREGRPDMPTSVNDMKAIVSHGPPRPSVLPRGLPRAFLGTGLPKISANQPPTAGRKRSSTGGMRRRLLPRTRRRKRGRPWFHGDDAAEVGVRRVAPLI